MKYFLALSLLASVAAAPVNATTIETQPLAALEDITAAAIVETSSEMTITLALAIAENAKHDVPRLNKKTSAAMLARENVVSELARPLLGE